MAKHPHWQSPRSAQVAKRDFVEAATNTVVEFKQRRITREAAIARLREAGAFEAEIQDLLAA